MKFYHYHQNNSGGYWAKDKPVDLIVRARDAKEADEKAQACGVYFDGCEDGRDCSCCGDRWHRAYESDADVDGPCIYGELQEVLEINKDYKEGDFWYVA